MLKGFCLLLVFASFEIANCQKPPRIPYVYLPGEKFSLPPICSNVAEWQDIALALQTLADMTEPKREKSAFTSLMNLIKFVLIKEELSCPVIQQMTRAGGKITNAMNSLQNSQIISKIEAALAKKPVKEMERVEVNDNLDIPNMIPVLRSRSKMRRKGPAVTSEKIKCNSTNPDMTNNLPPQSTPELKQNVGSLALFDATERPVANLRANCNCQCSKCEPLSLKLASVPNAKSNLPCQRLQIVNLSPVATGCCRSCNICRKLSNAVPTQCQSLRPMVLMGYQKQSNPVVRENQQNLVFAMTRNDTIPLMDCYGNMLNKVTSRILVPYCLGKLI